ncbi:hypothetical protein [Marinobacter salsuginis]|uniref:hypothetical protein n=1 Tax=Marinobacter salsuginis TaxID=418719 RepID=UPI001ADF97B7|nr:hypothetical protein [Marinobacter salsuginis]QTN41699.1 hypothetical protein HZ997_19070 [Marinobacter salsuginis]
MEPEKETYSAHVDYVEPAELTTLKPDSSAVTMPLPNGNLLFTFYNESIRLSRESLTISKDENRVISSSFGDDGSRNVREVIGRLEVGRKHAIFMRKALDDYLKSFEAKDEEGKETESAGE